MSWSQTVPNAVNVAGNDNTDEAWCEDHEDEGVEPEWIENVGVVIEAGWNCDQVEYDAKKTQVDAVDNENLDLHRFLLQYSDII